MSSMPSISLNAISPGASQKVAVGASSLQSTAVGASTNVVQLCATAACFVKTGTNPTAVADTGLYVPANVPVLVGISGSFKIAVIQAVGAGFLYITEGA